MGIQFRTRPCCLRDSKEGNQGCEPEQLGKIGRMKGVLRDWLKYFRTRAQVDTFTTLFHMYYGFQKVERSKRIAFYIILKHNDHRNQNFNF